MVRVGQRTLVAHAVAAELAISVLIALELHLVDSLFHREIDVELLVVLLFREVRVVLVAVEGD